MDFSDRLEEIRSRFDLLHYAHCPKPNGAKVQLLVWYSRHHENARALSRLDQLGKKLETVLGAKNEIENDDVRPGARCFKRLSPVGGHCGDCESLFTLD